MKQGVMLSLDQLKNAVWRASQGWKNAFNNGSASVAASYYEIDALLVAKPLGTFRGRDQIEVFWTDMIGRGLCDVEYIEPVLTVIDETSIQLESKWRMNKAEGVITKELWVLQADGAVLLREDHFEVFQ